VYDIGNDVSPLYVPVKRAYEGTVATRSGHSPLPGYGTSPIPTRRCLNTAA
jgi:hypothetical protein